MDDSKEIIIKGIGLILLSLAILAIVLTSIF
jgi:hypothetical protein